MTYVIRHTTRQSYRQAALVLARAFVDDPITVAVYKGYTPERQVRALTVDFKAEVLECVHRGLSLEVDGDGQVIAAAVIYPPGSYPLPVMSQWFLLFKSILGNGFYDFRIWMRWLNEVDKYHPTEPHYYLEYLGVEPEYQGKLAGTTLVKFLTNRADNERVGCYLENANPRNNPFYQRLGFQIMDEKVVIGVPTWFMWRPPAGI